MSILVFSNYVAIVMIYHVLGDFIFQTPWMAHNKSKSLKALSSHVAVYASMIVCAALVIDALPLSYVAAFVLINGVAHFCVDFVTSRITSRLWAKGELHDFFSIIGIDQLIHTLCLVYSLALLLGLK